ncbi:DMT family transporter [Nocardioides massiliensis]|uniref:Small multidrug resistance pump n=1 Tax=Nocardioides massiliensis TaxID=1325935 RepID=A0ABT9NRC9_9ACTN|nr:SMR family transporter [Nocardioides massiliensis]MDP9822987.1 small multidrug resistance pump [Nocardioides massiliensis]
MAWLFMAGAVGFEVSGTLALRVASQGRRPWIAVTLLSYLCAFALLTLALDAGMALGVAYGVWAACGVALTAVASRVLFKEPLTPTMLFGIGLIIIGVLLVELGAHH